MTDKTRERTVKRDRQEVLDDGLWLELVERLGEQLADRLAALAAGRLLGELAALGDERVEPALEEDGVKRLGQGVGEEEGLEDLADDEACRGESWRRVFGSDVGA
jgi:hypothetical protein